MRLRTALACAGPIAMLLLPAAAPAEEMAEDVDGPAWESLADVDTVEVVTFDEGGSKRLTTVWLVVVDGQGYIRTGDTRWGANVVRDPDVAIRIGDAEHAFRVDFVRDPGLRERIEAAFREKYGFMDSVVSLFRGGDPKIMRLTQP